MVAVGLDPNATKTVTVLLLGATIAILRAVTALLCADVVVTAMVVNWAVPDDKLKGVL